MWTPTGWVRLASVRGSSWLTHTSVALTSFRRSPTVRSTRSLGLPGTARVAHTTAVCTWCTRLSTPTRATTWTSLSASSDNNGATWSSPVRVNDDNTKNSQFLPKIALDPTSGNLAVVWYDSRNDLGAGGPGDTDGVPNDDAQFWGAFSTNDGQTFTKNIQISAGTSNSHDSGNGIDYGDYTGLSFYGGIAHPAWADNSNSTGNNPDGALHQLDIYTAAVPAP